MKIPKGEYFLGDPCYCFGKKWSDILDETDFFNRSKVIETESGPKILIAFNTAHGDGRYEDQHGNKYSVDAGLIGLVPVEIIDPKYSKEELSKLGRFVTFDENAVAQSNGGTLSFGQYVIKTDFYDDFNNDFNNDF